ncbi:unnamed protein product [Heterobilharzia americana]|nr:unnamed protein product [Heterobilharzia americana]
MNFLKWLTGLNGDSTNDNQLDYSFLFPVTIGVGSILICLAARYRNELVSFKSSMSRNPKDESNISARRGNAYANSKKKAKHSSKFESRTPQVQVQKQTEVKTSPPPVAIEREILVVPVPQTQYTAVPPPQTKQEVVTSTTDGIEAEFFNPTPKKPKKSKRSSKTKDPQSHDTNEQAEIDPAWVTVTSKKVKLSSRSTQKKKNSETEGDQFVAESLSPSESLNESPIQHKQQNNKQQELAFSNKSQLSLSEDKSTKLESSTNQVDSLRQAKAPTQVHPTASEHAKFVPENSRPVTSYEELLLKNLGAETVTAIRSLILNSESHTTRPVDSAPPPPPLPSVATDPVKQKSSPHTAAQLQAREAECQILRTEVVHLRDEVTMLKSLALNHVPVEKSMTDAETMTDPIESKSSNSIQSNDSDAILLSTLQAEIARLVKEVVIYQQRSENLRSRLDTANKKLSDSKSKSADEAKLLQQTLDAQSEKLHNLEAENKRLEKELNDALQKAEVHRRKLEESEHITTQRLEELEVLRLDNSSLRKNYEILENGASLLRDEKDNLAHKCDELNNKHTTILSELTASQSQCDDLKNQLKSLLCNSQTSEKSHINMIHTLEAKLERLTKEAEEQSKQIQLYESELERLHAEKNKIVEQTSKLSNEDKVIQTADEIDSKSNNHQSNMHKMNDSIDQTESDHFIVESTEYRLLQTQIEQYKSALDATELMLSKLQNSVNEEEARWHKALDAANIENELLKTKSNKLEAALSELVQDRNTLTKTIEELRKSGQFNNCNSVDTISDNSSAISFCNENKLEKSSSISPSPSSPLSTTTTDTDEQNMSRSELIHLVTKLRCLVEVERNALKQEQSLSAELRTRLNGTNSHDDNGNHNHSLSSVDDREQSSSDNPSEITNNCINHKEENDNYISVKSNFMHNNSNGDDNSNNLHDHSIQNHEDINKSGQHNNSLDMITKVSDCIPQHEISSNDDSYILLSNGIHKDINGEVNTNENETYNN